MFLAIQAGTDDCDKIMTLGLEEWTLNLERISILRGKGLLKKSTANAIQSISCKSEKWPGFAGRSYAVLLFAVSSPGLLG